jgi:hypothetical protein
VLKMFKVSAFASDALSVCQIDWTHSFKIHAPCGFQRKRKF